MKDLASLSSSALKAFLNSFDTVLCDLDGVICKLNSPIEGVPETIATLQKMGKKVYFITNNCTFRPEGMQMKLQEFKIKAELEDLAIPTSAIISYLKKINFKKEILVFGVSAMRQEFLKAGFKMAHSGPDRIDENLSDIPNHLLDHEEIGAVVVNFDPNFNYIKLQKACVYLQRPDVIFISAGNDKKVPTVNIPLIGPGHTVNMLEDVTQRSAVLFGKPSENFNSFVVEKFNIKDPSRVLFVGDSLEQDIKFASIHGYQKLLALTGISNLDELTLWTEKEKIPDFYIKSFGDLHDLITKLKN